MSQVQHLVSVNSSFLVPGYRVGCSCGWGMGTFDTHDEALAVGRRHQATTETATAVDSKQDSQSVLGGEQGSPCVEVEEA